jgi:hypothetical protein
MIRHEDQKPDELLSAISGKILYEIARSDLCDAPAAIKTFGSRDYFIFECYSSRFHFQIVSGCRHLAEALVPDLAPLKFSTWVPHSAIEIAEQLYGELATERDPNKAEEILRRLVSDYRMKRVWSELYRKKRVSVRDRLNLRCDVFDKRSPRAVALDNTNIEVASDQPDLHCPAVRFSFTNDLLAEIVGFGEGLRRREIQSARAEAVAAAARASARPLRQ